MAQARSISTKLTRLLQQAADPVYVLDSDRSILFCNAACAAWLGVESDSLQGRRVDYVAGDELHGVPGAAAGLCPPPEVFAGQALTGHVSTMSSEGRLLYRQARFAPLLDEDGDCLAVLAFLEHTDLHAADLQGSSFQPASTDQLHALLRQFRQELGAKRGVAELIGNSPATQQARAQVQLASLTHTSVCLSGPRGTGADQVAWAIHQRATRGAGRLIPLDCAILTPELWTAALADLNSGEKPSGERALLLSEIDALSPALHGPLLKLAKTAGGPRLISTTTRPLHAWRSEQPELAAALGTLPIELPALSARLADLPLIAQSIIEELNATGSRQLSGLSPEALEQLALYDWPENLQQLREVLRAGHAAARGTRLEAGDLPALLNQWRQASSSTRPAAPEPIDLDEVLRDVQIELIRRALDKSGDNRAQAARLLGLSRLKLYRRMQQLGMEEEGNAECGMRNAE